MQQVTFGFVALGAIVALGGFIRDPKATGTSGVSGRMAAQHADAAVTGEYHALRSFKFWDYDQKPCRIEVAQSSFNAEHTTSAGELQICEPNVGSAWKAVDLGSGRFVSAVQVCTNAGDSERLRGVRFWGVAIEPDGKVVEKGKPASFELGDCKKWHKRKSCPGGMVATGLRAYYDDGAHGFSALELTCNALKPLS